MSTFTQRFLADEPHTAQAFRGIGCFCPCETSLFPKQKVALPDVSKNAMFLSVRNISILETLGQTDVKPTDVQLLHSLYGMLKARLPVSWSIEIEKDIRREGKRTDAILHIESTNGARATIIVEIASRIDVERILYSRMLLIDAFGADGVLVLAPFISTSLRERLASAQINYADATGNLYLRLDNPAVYLERDVAHENPWPENRPLRSLKGPTAGRAVRAICDFRLPLGIRELAAKSHTSAAVISRVAHLLEYEALLKRDKRGTIIEAPVTDVIKRWAQDYSLIKSNAIEMCLEPRGVDNLLKKLQGAKWDYAVTGSLAAVQVAPFAPPRLGVVFVRDIEQAKTDLQMRSVERGANVLLAAPFDPVVFDRTMQRDGITYAGVAQVAADLLTSPGRGSEEGQELLRWMEGHKDAWQH